MIKKSNKYLYGIILSTAILSNNAAALESTNYSNLNLEEYRQLLREYTLYTKEVVLSLDISDTSNQTVVEKLKSTIEHAEDVAKNSNDLSEIEHEYYNLLKNVSYSLNPINIDIDTARDELQFLINECTQLYDDATFGDEDDKYPIEAGSAFYASIRNAQEVLDDIDSELEDLIDAKDRLEIASVNFIASKNNMSSLKAELLELIAATTELANNANIGFEIGDYPIEAKQNLINTINVAEEIYNNPLSKPSHIKAVIESMNNSVILFENSKITEIDRSQLISKITEMEVFSYSIVTGYSPGQYPEEEKIKFNTIIEEAKSIVGTCTYKESLDMIAKLDEAKSYLESKIIKFDDINRSDLNEQIAIAENLKDTSEIGTKPGQYPQESLNQLYAAIYSASEVRDRYSATQTEVDQATSSLKNSIKIFKDSVIKKPEINLSELMGLINQAEKLVNETPVGNNINEVPEGEKEKLQVVIDSAKIIADLSNPSQDVIDEASKNLKEAIIEFRNKIKTEVDKEYLSDEIKKAISLQSSISEDMIGDEVGMYPLDAKKRLDKAILQAQSVFEDMDATQDAVDFATKALSRELDIFKDSLIVEKVDKAKLNESIKKAEELLANAIIGNADGMYPKESYDKFRSIVESAKTVAGSLQTTQAMINSKVTELEGAMEAFLKSENVTYKEHIEKLKQEINLCEDLYSSTTEGNSTGEYPTSAREKFKQAIKNATGILNSGSKDSEKYINALNELMKEKDAYGTNMVDIEIIDKYSSEATKLLKEISNTIKSTNVGTVNGGVSENKKIALSVMHSRISDMIFDCDNVEELKEAIKLAEYSLSDFKDKSIYIDSDNVVHGRKLTGKVDKNSASETSISIVSKEEFIPQAGMPIDIKTLFGTLGTSLMVIGSTIMHKAKQKDKR